MALLSVSLQELIFKAASARLRMEKMACRCVLWAPGLGSDGREVGAVVMWSGVQVTKCGIKCSHEDLGLWTPAKSKLKFPAPVP